MNPFQVSKKRVYLAAFFLAATLSVVPAALASNPTLLYRDVGGGKSVNAVNNAANTIFVADSSNSSSHNATSTFNFVGVGGGDQFFLMGGANNDSFSATGMLNNTFTVLSGNGTSVFSLISGENSSFYIIQNNPINASGRLTFAITGGTNSTVFESSWVNNMTRTFLNATVVFAGLNSTGHAGLLGNMTLPVHLINNSTAPWIVGPTSYSINLGTNSTVDLGSLFGGNETTVNIIF